MRSPLLLALLTAVVLAAASCDDDGTGPDGDDLRPFSLEVEVLDEQGAPLAGMDVAVWNHPDDRLDPFLQDDFFGKRRAATTVRFQVPQTAVCSMAVTYPEGDTVWAYGDSLTPGTHAWYLGPGLEPMGGVTVYAYTLVCRDVESGAELFRDTRYMTRFDPDRDLATVGKTDEEGRLVLEGRNWAPFLSAPPDMPIVDEAGDLRGHFSLVDILRVRVYDADGNWKQVDQTVVEGPNVVKVTWGPTLAPPEEATADPAPPRRAADVVGGAPEVFSLEQNAPNPFN